MSKASQAALESMSQAVWYNQWTLKKFLPYLRGDILEVGCGIGNFTLSLAEYGEVWAIDINKEYIEETKRLIGNKAQIGFGDIERGKYFFGSQKFNSIVCLNVLEHIKDDNLAINNLYKLLKIEGTLILLIPSHQFLYGEIDKAIGHFRRYTELEISEKLKTAGFMILKHRRINFLGAIGWLLTGKIFREATVGYKKIKMFNSVAPFILPLEDLIEPPLATSILVIAKRKN